MTARLITLNDLYSFEPDVQVDVDQFTDIIGRHFRQPARKGSASTTRRWRTCGAA